MINNQNSTILPTIPAVKEQIQPKKIFFCGSYLLESISDKIGLIDDLKFCFPKDYQKILSLAFYLVQEINNPMYRFKTWGLHYYHPYGHIMSSQRISDLFNNIDEAKKMEFLERQTKRSVDHEFIAYDTTSISSYFELIKQVKYGHNKDNPELPQINLALLLGEQSVQPFYYRVLPGNISDVKTVEKLTNDLSYLTNKEIKLVLDRGFYSSSNIDKLCIMGYKFIIGVKNNIGYVSDCIDDCREEIKDHTNYYPLHKVYCKTYNLNWSWKVNNLKSLTKQTKQPKLFLHVFYNGVEAEIEKQKFSNLLYEAEEDLKSKKPTEHHKEITKKYFVTKKIKGRLVILKYNDKAIKDKLNECGYFSLLTNDKDDAKEALDIYRNKDLVEKSFNNLKNRLNLKTTVVESVENLEGKLFVQFISLILMSYVHKKMKEHKLYSNFTMQSCFDMLNLIERYEYPGQLPYYNEITKKQREIFDFFEVPQIL